VDGGQLQLAVLSSFTGIGHRGRLAPTRLEVNLGQ